MSQVLDLKNVVEDIITSYEIRVRYMKSIFDATHLIYSEFTRQEREKINTQLRDILAMNESLRRKDFNNMMQGILSNQDEREKEISNLLNRCFNEQKEIGDALRKGLARFKDPLAKGEEAQRVKEFQEMIKDILAKQDKRKEEVTSKLKEFQKEQQEMASRLKELLGKGRELRIKDLKSMLIEFNAQHKERLVRQRERKKEVRHILGEFKRERTKAAQNWRTMQAELAHKRAASPKAVEMNAPIEGVEK